MALLTFLTAYFFTCLAIFFFYLRSLAAHFLQGTPFLWVWVFIPAALAELLAVALALDAFSTKALTLALAFSFFSVFLRAFSFFSFFATILA